MLLNIRTSHSDTGIHYMPDFPYLYDLARCSKCQLFILLSSTNKLYGFIDDCCSIHEIDVPFHVDTDLLFRLDSVSDKSYLDGRKYFAPREFGWFMLPEYYWASYINGDLYSEYDPMINNFVIKDKCTLQPIEFISMRKYRYSDDYMTQDAFNQLDNFIKRQYTLGIPYEFTELEKNPVFRRVYDNKAAIGRQLVKLQSDSGQMILFYIYKSLFTLNKADTLSMEIQFDKFNTSEFMATFKPKRKKNPMLLNTYGTPFEEKIYCMYRNLS